MLDLLKSKQLSPKYYENKLVKAAIAEGRDPPLPLALFSDGVSYQRQAAGRSKTATILQWRT